VLTGDEKTPYWRDVGTVDAFWKANLDLTDYDPPLDLYSTEWPIWTYSELTPPAKFIHDEENRRGTAIQSLVCGGVILSGASAMGSLLFTGVHCHSYSELENVVALPYSVVHRGARVKNAVLDRGVEVPAGLVIGEDPALDAERFRVSENGVALVTQPMIDKLGR
jgi:glucose-1-phosphate adenylyltransferase